MGAMLVEMPTISYSSFNRMTIFGLVGSGIID